MIDFTEIEYKTDGWELFARDFHQSALTFDELMLSASKTDDFRQSECIRRRRELMCNAVGVHGAVGAGRPGVRGCGVNPGLRDLTASR